MEGGEGFMKNQNQMMEMTPPISSYLCSGFSPKQAFDLPFYRDEFHENYINQNPDFCNQDQKPMPHFSNLYCSNNFHPNPSEPASPNDQDFFGHFDCGCQNSSFFSDNQNFQNYKLGYGNGVFACQPPSSSKEIKEERTIWENASESFGSSLGSTEEALLAKKPKEKSNQMHKRPNLVKGQWTLEEDRLLIHLVDQYGVRKWSQIAKMFKGRVGKQCRERWHNHLRPNIKKDTWTEEEEKLLVQAHLEIGNKWAEIARRLPGRTENAIKNHWNATKRRQLSRKKTRASETRQNRASSILQDYIKSLNQPSPSPSPSPSITNLKTEPAAMQAVNQFLGEFHTDRSMDFYHPLFSGLPPFPFMEEEGTQKLEAPPLELNNVEFEQGRKEMDLMELISQQNF
ncbi:hypothetical protein AMTR_s00096p00076220 [Amborella trichopoda]|uniref:Uncharacterized protein n=1 Tax=Amborella trichopoda TaxID=13333 RepID=W1P373_AMBTC|nr:hypothetical protein AMTR_s00096p00076220 [Amborella trichopoda]